MEIYYRQLIIMIHCPNSTYDGEYTSLVVNNLALQVSIYSRSSVIRTPVANCDLKFVRISELFE